MDKPPSPSTLSFKVLTLFTRFILPAILTSILFDLTLSAINGYTLRVNPGVLAILNAFFLSTVIIPSLGILFLAQRVPGVGSFLRDAPWFTVIMVAWVPIALVLLWWDHGLIGLIVQVHVMVLIAGVGFLEVRRQRKIQRWVVRLVAAVAGLIILWLTFSPPIPGRFMLLLIRA